MHLNKHKWTFAMVTNYIIFPLFQLKINLTKKEKVFSCNLKATERPQWNDNCTLF